jgi:hypothetical protein
VHVPQVRPGTYRIRVALLDPQTRKPAIQLGIAGRAEDGWYELGKVKVD